MLEEFTLNDTSPQYIVRNSRELDRLIKAVSRFRFLKINIDCSWPLENSFPYVQFDEPPNIPILGDITYSDQEQWAISERIIPPYPRVYFNPDRFQSGSNHRISELLVPAGNTRLLAKRHISPSGKISSALAIADYGPKTFIMEVYSGIKFA